MADDISTSSLEKIAYAYLHEQKRRRFWSIFFKLIFFLFIVMTFLLSVLLTKSEPLLSDSPHVAFIEVPGIIMEDAMASADNVAGALHHAYKSRGTKGVILRINSPGGSPVQADYIYAAIKRYKAKYPEIPVYAVCSDMCASAAYYIAAAADKIYANESSIVGSIGVLYNGFGMTELMHKLGVERRLLTAGARKGFLDPFSPESDADKVHMHKVLNMVHQRFIERVKAGRGERLQQQPDLFSGLFWSGYEAKTLGLVDDFASSGTVAREIIGLDKIIDYTQKPNFYDRFAKKFGSEIKNNFLSLLNGAGFLS